MARKPPLPMCPSQSPSEIEIAQAIAIAAKDSCRCGHISSQSSPSPPTCVPPAGDSRSVKMKLDRVAEVAEEGEGR